MRDAELDAALASVHDLLPADESAAARVHDLAVAGAAALRADAERRLQLRLELADMAASETPPWDPEVLADIDALAWGRP